MTLQFPGGSIVGGAFAGLFALTWWPWAFFSLAIALVVVVGFAYFIIPEPPSRPDHESRSWRDKLKLLDLPGAAVGITALVLFNFAWNQAPIAGWHNPYVYVTLILGLLLIPAFFYVEYRISPDPLVPFQALTVEVGFVLACIACGWSSFGESCRSRELRPTTDSSLSPGIWVFYLVSFLENLRGASPLLTVAYFSPVAVSGALASVCTGLLLSRVRAAWVMVMALAAFLVGQILAGTVPVDQTYWAQTFICTIIITW